jgi:hypothetical protein
MFKPSGRPIAQALPPNRIFFIAAALQLSACASGHHSNGLEEAHPGGACQKDTDCKGERICEDSRCASPRPSAVSKGSSGQADLPRQGDAAAFAGALGLGNGQAVDSRGLQTYGASLQKQGSGDAAAQAPSAQGPGRPAIFLDVDSNRPVHAWVRHHDGDGSVEPTTDLGEVPLRRVAGAHVRDTLILKLEQLDIYYEQEIPFGEPGQTVRIKQDFHIGYYELNLKPKGLHNIALHLNTLTGLHIGTFPPPVKLELAEGVHKLVLEGEQLNRPAEIDIEVKRDQTITGKPFDLGVLMSRQADK